MMFADTRKLELIQQCIGHCMSRLPQPLFDTFECFHKLNFLQLSNERSTVQEYLKSLDDSCRSIDSYLIARSFLKSYAGNQ